LAEPAPLFGTDRAPVPPGATAEWFVGAGGARLRAALFPALGAARGSVVLSPGRTEPIEKYFEVAAELTARGFVVLAHDWRGQGLSQRLLLERLKGHAVGYHDVLADYRALIDTFEARLPAPRLAVGHSMGGGLTALALAKGERRFAAAVLSAPMFGIFTPPLPPPVTRVLAATLSAAGLGGGMVPGASLTAPPEPFETNVLTHDPARYARNVEQITLHRDLALGPPTWGWLDFAFAAIAELRGGAGVAAVPIPVTVIAAGADRLVDNRVVRLVTDRFPRGEYIEIAGAHHEILQETDAIRAVFWREFDALAGTIFTSPASPRP
jgi:lysophospholipase